VSDHPVRPAPVLRRGAAALVDGVLVWLIYVAAILAGELVPEGDIDQAEVFLARMAIAIGVIAATFLYFIVPEARFGRTPGKALLGLRVVMSDGKPVTRRGAVIRNFVRPLDFMWFYAIGIVVALANPRRQRIGDMAARTVVVEG
jgi:uncharacterized RDD family membrane protein YckC